MPYDELVKRLRELPHLLFVQLHGHEDVVYQAADAIEELSRKYIEERNAAVELTGELASKPRWIAVTDRSPEQGRRYLVIRFDEVTKTQFIDILWHDAHDLWWNRLYKGQYNVTHWMPLPELPKGET